MSRFNSRTRIFLEYAMITAGCFITALSLSLLLEPNHILTGGATGVGIILQGLCETFGWPFIPLWVTNTVLNVPLLLIGLKVNGLAFTKRTLYAALVLSAMLYLTNLIPRIEVDMFLASIFGGALCGLGLGVVFRFNATTGGSDLAANIIKHFKRHMSLARLILIIDSVVIAGGLFVFGVYTTLYCLIALYISTKTIDLVLEGLSFSKAAFIISDYPEKIAAGIDKALERGATILHGQGAYTKNPKNVLLCVVSAKEIAVVKDVTREIDEKAFMIVADVREVLGEGFKPLS